MTAHLAIFQADDDTISRMYYFDTNRRRAEEWLIRKALGLEESGTKVREEARDHIERARRYQSHRDRLLEVQRGMDANWGKAQLVSVEPGEEFFI